MSMEEPSPSFNMHRTSMKAAGKGLEVCLRKNYPEIKIGNIMEVNQKRCVSKMRMVYFCNPWGGIVALYYYGRKGRSIVYTEVGRETLPIACEFDLV